MKNILVLNSKEDANRIYGASLPELGANIEYFIESIIDPKDAIRKYKPSLILAHFESSPSNRILISQAKRESIPVVYVVDGVIEWSYLWNNQEYVKPGATFLQPLLADAICVIGNHQARILSMLGLAEKVEVIGLPRFDPFQRERIVDQEGKHLVVVATATTPFLNSEQEVYVKKALRDLVEYFKGNDNYVVEWRVSSAIASELGVEWAGNNHIVLYERLKSASALVSFSSTCILEGMFIGVPTCQIDYRALPKIINTAWNISSKEQIESIMRQMIFPEQELVAFQAHCLEDELLLGNASDRLLNVIMQMLEGEKRSTLQSKTKAIIDFRQTSSHISEFSVNDNTLLQYELKAYKSHLGTMKAQLENLVNGLQKHIVIRLIYKLRFIPGTKRIVRVIDSFKGLLDS